jgi:hypothetical protein
MSKKRRQFTREFKLEALRLVEESSMSIGQVAGDLGIHETMLRRWRDRAIVERLGKSATDLFPGNGKLPGMQFPAIFTADSWSSSLACHPLSATSPPSTATPTGAERPVTPESVRGLDQEDGVRRLLLPDKE